MKITVFGASGKTGRRVVDEVLGRGHEVVAYVRDPSRFVPPSESLSIIAGGTGDQAPMATAVAGADCIISAMGSGRDTLTVLAETLVPLLVAKGPKRIVTLGGAGCELPGDPQTLGRRFFLLMMQLGGAPLIADIRAHWAALLSAGLACTLVRPPRLSDGPATGRLRHGTDIALDLMDSVSRADLAAFMTDIALDGRYIGEAPFVAKA